ncbi:MAG: hydrogenase nickel incorporation protein HypB [Actinomycetota bacterium]
MSAARIVELRKDVLDHHDQLAAGLRTRFERAGVVVVNLLSSPGTGKTELLGELLAHLRAEGRRVAALVGDCATENDGERLAASGAAVRQIVTEGMCHLEADMISAHLDGWELDELDTLFIENVGNLVCPGTFDLGESQRVVLLSVTEGEDKPLKYPQMFHSADVVVITKIDLAEACEFDRDAALAAIETVRPGARVIETSARTGVGLAELAHVLAPVPSVTT